MILVIAGMSCAGKDTLQNYLMENGFTGIVSTTTRPMRPGEIDHVNYHFKSVEEFKKLIENDELIEWRKYNTTVKGIPDSWFYGVERSSVNLSDKTVVVLDSSGYYKFVQTYGNDNVKLLWLEIPTEVRRARNKLRKDYDECEFNRREQKDKELFGDLKDHADYIVQNDGNQEDLFNEINKILCIGE